MPAIVLIGAQWGDEGKGKATDLLGDSVQYVVRYQGGNNAGHTVVIGEEKYALHVLPSGVLSPEVTPVIGNGVVIDPKALFEEIDALQERGVSCDRLLVSGRWIRSASGSSATPRSAPPAGASARPTATRSPGSASGSRTCSIPASSGRSSISPCGTRTRC
jgi:hypothetical protein